VLKNGVTIFVIDNKCEADLCHESLNITTVRTNIDDGTFGFVVQCLNTALNQTKAPEVREHYIYSFNQGRHEARMQVGRQEIRGSK